MQHIVPPFYGSSRDKDIDRFQISIESVYKVKVSRGRSARGDIVPNQVNDIVQLAVMQHIINPLHLEFVLKAACSLRRSLNRHVEGKEAQHISRAGTSNRSKDKNKATQRGDKWNRLYKALEVNSLYPF